MESSEVHWARPDMQQNAHGTGLKAGIQLGHMSSETVGLFLTACFV